MPHYIIERTVSGVPSTREGFRETALKSKSVIAAMPGVVWVRSYLSAAEGKIYCEYYAPSAEAVLEHARRVGVPVDRISEVALEVSPDMFV